MKIQRRRFSLLHLYLFVGVLLFVLSACAEDAELTLPDVRGLPGRATWAVAEPAYVRVYGEAGIDASVVGHLRKGEPAGIKHESYFTDEVDGVFGRWYQIENERISGWVFGSKISRYPSRDQAMTVAGEHWR